MPSTAIASVRAMIMKSLVLARNARGLDLLRAISTRGITSLPRHVAAALGAHLVLDVDAGDAGLLEILHGVMHVHRIAVAGVGVGGQRDRERAREHARHASTFSDERHDADVGLAEQRVGEAGARGRGLLKPIFSTSRAL